MKPFFTRLLAWTRRVTLLDDELAQDAVRVSRARHASSRSRLAAQDPGKWYQRAVRAYVRLQRRRVGAFIESHRPELLAFACRRAGDEDLAEDAVQHVSMKLLARPSVLLHHKSPLAWALLVARNYIIDRFRANERERGLLRELLQRLDLETEQAPPPISRQELLEAIDGLPDAQRQVVKLRLIGYRLTEVADLLNKPGGTVRALHAKAVKTLRRVLVSSKEL